ncbi:hypothetical protein M9Y10_022590 [Tritrichomonas musculus]|uniref:RRM domain-containing protein n=1 Tax=Tritrichomonas musculus TaxID=1915356 RepID=A0ABR2KSP0_9EUKA
MNETNWSDFLATPPNLSSLPLSIPIPEFNDTSMPNSQNMFLNADQYQNIFARQDQNNANNPHHNQQTQNTSLSFQQSQYQSQGYTNSNNSNNSTANNVQQQSQPPYTEYNEIENRNLLVTNLSPQVTQEEIQTTFNPYKSVKSIDQSNLQNGVITIEYYDLRHAQNIKRMTHRTSLHGNEIHVTYAPLQKIEDPRKPPNNGTIVVFHLPQGINDQHIEQSFSPYGEIRQIRGTPAKPTQRFIEYWDTRSAEAALNNMSGTFIMGSRVSIEFSLPGGFRRTVQRVDQPTIVRNQH